ncbi:hypothetical protein GCM10010358_39480 [Streptomyces minutiscleroticus]|uniref:Uncharacterized protein n=1 Tax=Streptomyces minutiscleroticus TaxID=68238 RepID=A0A918NMK9_9ACTN|nr:hypothetical protein GCM10010358_39480 [Streptomyces minutiscleroticus]
MRESGSAPPCPAKAAARSSIERCRRLNGIDPVRCTAWEAGRQRRLRLVRAHPADGGRLST